MCRGCLGVNDEGLEGFCFGARVCVCTRELKITRVRALYTGLSWSSKKDYRFDDHGGLGFLWAFMTVSKRRGSCQSGLWPSGSLMEVFRVCEVEDYVRYAKRVVKSVIKASQRRWPP